MARWIKGNYCFRVSEILLSCYCVKLTLHLISRLLNEREELLESYAIFSVCMVNLAICGLVLAFLLFLTPSFILLNVGFRCSSLLNPSGDVIETYYCEKVDGELSYALIGSGFVFLLFALGTLAFTIIVWLNSRHSIERKNGLSEKTGEISIV